MEGIDYEETLSPTVKYDSIMLLLALAANEDLDIHQMDVENAYLASDLEETIYMRRPDGVNVKGKVCRLTKGLYSFKARNQAIRLNNLESACQGGPVPLRRSAKDATTLGFTIGFIYTPSLSQYRSNMWLRGTS